MLDDELEPGEKWWLNKQREKMERHEEVGKDSEEWTDAS